MGDIIEKIGSYNLFNYLLPGILYAVLLNAFTSYNLIFDDILITAFTCYFAGMVISRLGSLILQPLLEKMKILKFKGYQDFVLASQKDPKLDVLSEQNNTYRTIVSMLILVVLTKGYELLGTYLYFLSEYEVWVAITLLVVIFISAYRKQTKYISKRIDTILNSQN